MDYHWTDSHDSGSHLADALRKKLEKIWKKTGDYELLSLASDASSALDELDSLKDEKEMATGIPGSIRVTDRGWSGGDYWLTVGILNPDFEEVSNLPAGLEYKGRLYGRTGWDSDKLYAIYSTVAWAQPAREG